MAGDDFNVRGEILVKRCELRRFAGCLTANDGADFGRGSILRNNLIDMLSFYAVDDPVAESRN